MKAGSHCMPEVCPETSSTAQLVHRGFADPSPADVETGPALGSDPRSDDASLARPWQKRRWWTWVALGCLLICALGGADADHSMLKFFPPVQVI